MAIDQRALHELLDERSRPAFERPIPWQALRRRTGRARSRRLTAAVATAAALAVGVPAVVLGGWPGSREPGDLTAVSVADPIPARYVEPDGTVYRRVGAATLDPARGGSASFDVEVSGKPLAVLPDCQGGPSSGAPSVSARVPGVAKIFTLWGPLHLNMACDHGRAVDLMPLPEGTRRATFAVEASRSATARPRAWRIGVYEWTPPVRPKAAPAPVEPPAAFSRKPEFRRIAAKTVTWPAEREITLMVPHTGRQLAVLTYCGGGIAGRIDQENWVNGRAEKSTVHCGNPPPRGRGFNYSILGKPPAGEKTVTLRIRISATIPEYLRRTGTLTVAVYEAAE